MQRSVACRIEADVDGLADVVLAIAVAATTTLGHESLAVTVDGVGLPVREVLDDHGGRLHLVDGVSSGHLLVTYDAIVRDRAPDLPVTDLDRIRYGRPSRYCESDRLAAFAQSEFRELRGLTLLESVSSWVGQRVAYVAGSSRPTDGAVSTLLAREGVCRDFAHLVIAMLRACDMPARLVSVYAPGLQPMDFHAVAEAIVDGEWLVVDATALAPRHDMVRIATGRDAADSAFLSVVGESVVLRSIDVRAITDTGLSTDDANVRERLG